MNAIGYIVKDGSGRVLLPKSFIILKFIMETPNQIHRRGKLSSICGFEGGGRACDTYISDIRKCLGSLSFRIVSKMNTGYGWVGDPVDLLPVSKVCALRTNGHQPGMVNHAVLSHKDVAKRLGLKLSAVKLIEKRALRKLSENPEMKQAWVDLISFRKRYSYDPFHEIWLFSVQESIPKFGVSEKERVVEE